VLSEEKKGVEILAVAASHKIVAEWQKFFQKLNLEIEFFDIEILATFRGLFDRAPGKPVCIVDIGAVTTNIAVFNKQSLRYSYSLKIAGKAITREIAKSLKIKVDEAEEQKIKIGLSEKDNRLFPIIVKKLEPIVSEIKAALNYIQTKIGGDVKEVILVGGSSQLRGIVDYFKVNLNLSVRLGELNILKKKVPLVYITATGLALRGISSRWSKDPVIDIRTLKYENIKTGTLKSQEAEMQKDEENTSDQSSKLHKQIILLVIILVIGVTAIGGVFWYRNYEKAQKEEELKSQIEEYTEIQSLDVQVPVAVEEATTTEEILEQEITTIIVKETPTGWLNVRQGSSSAYSIITKVNTGESYELLEEGDEWIKIKLSEDESEDREGWVFSEYVEKVE